MRNLLILSFLLLFACGPSDEAANQSAAGEQPGGTIKQVWGTGRDRLCLQNERAGLIVYAAQGDANCMVRGTAEGVDATIRIKPDGDESCTITARLDNGSMLLGEVSPACAYYCGPKASYAGKRLGPSDTAKPAVDVAGEPLC
jgi:hypothetical protein